jgi:hypothetical protein
LAIRIVQIYFWITLWMLILHSNCFTTFSLCISIKLMQAVLLSAKNGQSEKWVVKKRAPCSQKTLSALCSAVSVVFGDAKNRPKRVFCQHKQMGE